VDPATDGQGDPEDPARGVGWKHASLVISDPMPEEAPVMRMVFP